MALGESLVARKTIELDAVAKLRADDKEFKKQITDALGDISDSINSYSTKWSKLIGTNLGDELSEVIQHSVSNGIKEAFTDTAFRKISQNIADSISSGATKGAAAASNAISNIDTKKVSNAKVTVAPDHIRNEYAKAIQDLHAYHEEILRLNEEIGKINILPPFLVKEEDQKNLALMTAKLKEFISLKYSKSDDIDGFFRGKDSELDLALSTEVSNYEARIKAQSDYRKEAEKLGDFMYIDRLNEFNREQALREKEAQEAAKQRKAELEAEKAQREAEAKAEQERLEAAAEAERLRKEQEAAANRKPTRKEKAEAKAQKRAEDTKTLSTYVEEYKDLVDQEAEATGRLNDALAKNKAGDAEKYKSDINYLQELQDLKRQEIASLEKESGLGGIFGRAGKFGREADRYREDRMGGIADDEYAKAIDEIDEQLKDLLITEKKLNEIYVKQDLGFKLDKKDVDNLKTWETELDGAHDKIRDIYGDIVGSDVLDEKFKKYQSDVDKDLQDTTARLEALKESNKLEEQEKKQKEEAAKAQKEQAAQEKAAAAEHKKYLANLVDEQKRINTLQETAAKIQVNARAAGDPKDQSLAQKLSEDAKVHQDDLEELIKQLDQNDQMTIQELADLKKNSDARVQQILSEGTKNQDAQVEREYNKVLKALSQKSDSKYFQSSVDELNKVAFGYENVSQALYDINNVQVRFNQLTQEEHQELVDAQKAVKDARSAYDEYANARARIYELTSKQKLGKTSIKEDQELENLQSSLGQLAGKWVDAKTNAEGYSDIASKELEDLNQHIEQQNKLLDDSFNGFEQKTNDALGQRQLEAATKAAKDYLKSVNDWGDAVIASIKAGDSGSFEKEETAARNLSLAINNLSTNLTELTQYEEQYGDVVATAIADGKVLTEAYNEQAEAVKLDIAVKHQKKEDAETQKQLTAAVRDYCKELENYLKLEREIADKRSSSDSGGADTIKLNEQLANSYDYLGQKLKDIGDIGGENALLAVSQITAKRVDENNRLIQTIEDANARKLRQKEIDDQQKSTYKQLVDETNRYYTALAKLEQLRTKRNITPDSSELAYWRNERDAADAARKSIRSANQKATGSEYLTDEYEAAIQKIEEKGTRTVDRLHEKAEAFFRSMGEDLGDTVRTWQEAQDAIMSHLNNEYASFDIAKAFDGNKLVANVKQIDGSINSVTYTWDKMNQTIRQTEGPVNGANTSFSKLGTAVSGFVNQIGRMVAGYMSINALFNAIKSGVGYVRDLDKALTELQLVTQTNDETISQFAASASEVAQQLALTTEEVIRSQTEWARLGYNAKDALDLAAAAAKLATAGFMTTEESTSQLTSAIQAFYADDIRKGVITAGDAAMEISDKMVYVGNNFAITSEGIGQSLQLASSAMLAAGNTLDDTIALTTTANSIMQSPQQIANALKVVSMRLRGTDVKKISDEVGEDVDIVNTSFAKLYGTVKKLTAVKSNNFEGISILTDTGQFKSTRQILSEIAEIYDEISDASQAALLEQLAGRFLPEYIEICA